MAVRLRGADGEFLMRPTRAAWRGGVVEVAILVDEGNIEPYAARWRVVV